MNPKTRLGIIVVSVIAAAVAGLALAHVLLPRLAAVDMGGEEGTFLGVKSALTTANMALCIVLMATYLRLYSEIKSKFTLGLLFVMFSLFVYAATSNPVIHALIGYCLKGLGPFTMLPDIFATIALGILLYLSEK